MRHDWPWALLARIAPRWAARHRAAPRDVLVVDDDHDMVEVMSAVLDGDGYPCRGANNGQHALDLIAERLPALVLLDMQMPVMNGWECARRLRADHGRTVPIVVVTSARHVVEWGDQVDADGVLGKPFSIDQLIRVVARYVQPTR
jgi:CheY-like chemotaxis protein